MPQNFVSIYGNMGQDLKCGADKNCPRKIQKSKGELRT
jgi:hypothetical protein